MRDSEDIPLRGVSLFDTPPIITITIDENIRVCLNRTSAISIISSQRFANNS